MGTQPDILTLFLLGTGLLFLFSTFLVLFLVVQKRKQYRHLLEKERMQNTYQNQLLQTKLEVQEQSFKYLSDEIHDNILQGLGSVKFQLHSLVYDMTDAEIKNKISGSNELLGQSISNLRNISHTFNNSFVARERLITSVQTEAGYINSAKLIKCSISSSGEEFDLETEKKILSFRIIQEGRRCTTLFLQKLFRS